MKKGMIATILMVVGLLAGLTTPVAAEKPGPTYGSIIPPGGTTARSAHLIFRVHLVGKFPTGGAVEGTVATNVPVGGRQELYYGIAPVVSGVQSQWVRFDFTLPVGRYKVHATVGKQDPYSDHIGRPWWAWTEWPIPIALDRDRDVTLTLDP